MPVNQSSWAERINKAKSGGGGNFEPVPLKRLNFIVEDDPVVASGDKGEYIKYRAKVAPGQERENALVFEMTFPFAENPFAFLDLFSAMGYDEQWLLQADPSTEEIASALKNRPFSAEVYVRDESKTDKSGHPYRSLRNFRPVQAQDAAPQAPAPAPTQAASAPGGSPWGAGASTTPPPAPTPDQTGGSPWGASTTPPPNPFG